MPKGMYDMNKQDLGPLCQKALETRKRLTDTAVALVVFARAAARHHNVQAGGVRCRYYLLIPSDEDRRVPSLNDIFRDTFFLSVH